jgi:hypothetical protein
MPNLTNSKNNEAHTCINCGAQFTGNICSRCGEKVFHPSQLGIKHFFHQVFEFFTHFENKVLKSIWLTFSKPGFITKENLRGVRVSYARPVQLFIVVNLLFYLTVTVFQRTDYTPMIGDMSSNQVSTYPYFKWAKPYDDVVIDKLSTLYQRKLDKFKGDSIRQKLLRGQIPDTAIRRLEPLYRQPVFIATYISKVSVYSKTLIFILIPVFALLFFLLFYKRLRYYGSALVLATHFLAFNLLLHSLTIIVNFAPWTLFQSRTFSFLPAKAISFLFYNDWLAPFSNIFLGIYDGFEAVHVIFFWIWLFVAFRRIFNLNIWHNLLVSYLLSRIFFLIIFSFYKKFVIAFTLWNM